VKKTDAKAAQLLARYLAKRLLPKVRMKDKQHGQIASLTQTRDALVKHSHRAGNYIKREDDRKECTRSNGGSYLYKRLCMRASLG
jgi:hypothetical protein